jgi:antitoxin FitA
VEAGGAHRNCWLVVGASQLSDPIARLRYSSAMATIQIRDIPEDAYETIRKRARSAGRSIQSYMRDWVISFAAEPTTDEVLAIMESTRAAAGSPGATPESILADLAADRR